VNRYLSRRHLFFVSNIKFIVFKPPLSQQKENNTTGEGGVIEISLEMVWRCTHKEKKGRAKG
jgi:hypothetical protein